MHDAAARRACSPPNRASTISTTAAELALHVE